MVKKGKGEPYPEGKEGGWGATAPKKKKMWSYGVRMFR
jgi:hypothetical protein